MDSTQESGSKVVITNPIVWVSERLTIRGSKLQDSASVFTQTFEESKRDSSYPKT